MFRHASSSPLVLASGQILRESEELRVNEPEQRPKRLFVARVRGRGDEDEVARSVFADALDQLVALMTRPARCRVVRARMRLVDDDEFRAGA